MWIYAIVAFSLYKEGHNGVSTANKEKEKYLIKHFWRKPKNKLVGQDHQQDLYLLHTYGQLKISFGYGGGVVQIRAFFPKLCNKEKMAKFSGHFH